MKTWIWEEEERYIRILLVQTCQKKTISKIGRSTKTAYYLYLSQYTINIFLINKYQ